ncbi:MAG: chloride channel protein [Gemmatimonadaceae bacterium]|nr:chloride channel protein [Gemmatimonadaceae bacterium]
MPQRTRSEVRRLSRGATRQVLRSSRSVWDRVLAVLDRFGLDDHAVLLFFGAVIGVAAGGGVVLFYRVIDLSYEVFFRWPEQVLPQLPRLLYRPLTTALAITAAWWTWRRLGRGQDGMTVPDVQLAVMRRRGRIHSRRAAGRTLASAMTIGGGGSAGSEGPVAVLGATLGSLISRLFQFPAERTRVFVGAGAAAGISAAFNAPLAGAFFALEEILGSFHAAHFAPVVVASVAGAILSRAVFGNHPAFLVPEDYSYQNTIEVALFFPLLGVLCAVVSVLFVRWHFAIGARAAAWRERHPRAEVLQPIAAGLLVGGMVVASRGQLVGTGHLSIPLEGFTHTAWWALLLLAVGKILATSVTLQGGGSGGLFTPSLFVGGAVGASMGVLIRTFIPSLPIAVEAYALVGMGAVVAATPGAPPTAILLVFEITGDYAIVPPLMVAVVICQLLARRFERDDLYSGWLRRRGVALPSHAAPSPSPPAPLSS